MLFFWPVFISLLVRSVFGSSLQVQSHMSANKEFIFDAKGFRFNFWNEKVGGYHVVVEEEGEGVWNEMKGGNMFVLTHFCLYNEGWNIPLQLGSCSEDAILIIAFNWQICE